MKVLVTGANGFIGLRLCQYLIAIGSEVVPAVRRRTDIPNEKILTSDAEWISALAGCDVVVHLAGRAHVMKDEFDVPLIAEYRRVNVQQTLALARQAAVTGVHRFVYISSVKVNGEHTASNTAFHVGDAPEPKDAYGISKYEAEQGLMVLARETGMEVIIVRPPLVYGPGVKGNFATLVRVVRKGIPLPLGAVHNKRSLVALENLVNFIALCSNPERSPLAANEVFLISDSEDVSTTELLCKVANAYNVGPRLLPIPAILIRTAIRLLGKPAMADRLLGSLVIDSSKARDLLGWKPVVSMSEQLKMMALYDANI